MRPHVLFQDVCIVHGFLAQDHLLGMLNTKNKQVQIDVFSFQTIHEYR
jgi:hypothetical protein